MIISELKYVFLRNFTSNNHGGSNLTEPSSLGNNLGGSSPREMIDCP